jgi:hypothetical protein
MSGGKFEVKFFEPGALIPPLECFDAVSKGSIESCWTTPGYTPASILARLLHHRAVRPEHGRVSGVEVVRRRQQAA